MKTAEDFRMAFGEPDEGFDRALCQALEHTQRNVNTPARRFRCKAVVIAIVLLVLLTSTAYAADAVLKGLGIITRMQTSPLPDAQRLVQQNIVQTGGESEFADFTAEEAIWDGHAMYILLDIAPREEGTLFLPHLWKPGSMLAQLTLRREDADITVREWAEEHGYERFMNVRIELANAGGIIPASVYPQMIYGEDGTQKMTVMIPIRDTFDDPSDVTLWCTLSSIPGTKQYDARAILTCSLTAPSAKETVYRSDEEHYFEQIGLTVRQVQLTCTPLATYVNIEAEFDQEAIARKRSDLPTPGTLRVKRNTPSQTMYQFYCVDPAGDHTHYRMTEILSVMTEFPDTLPFELFSYSYTDSVQDSYVYELTKTR